MYVFVLGTGRCGSTLVHEVLSRHEDVGFLSNLEDRSRGRLGLASAGGRLFQALPPAASQKGRLRFAPSEGYRIMDAAVSPGISRPFRDLTAADASPWLVARLRRFFDERAAASGRRVFLHKFTGWPRAGLLHAAFPDARFVHVYRDGRAVATSFLQMSWWTGWLGPQRWQWGPLPADYQEIFDRHDRSFPVLAGLNWRLLMDAFSVAQPLVPAGQWLDLRYEDMLDDPHGTLARAVESAGLAWTPTFAKGVDRYRFSTARARPWLTELSATDVAGLEDAIGPALQAWGYPL